MIDKELIIEVESVPGNGIDLVLYDVTEVEYHFDSVDEFHEYCGKQGYNEEDFEIDRVTLVQVD